MFCAPMDKCVSIDCPRYKTCGRAQREAEWEKDNYNDHTITSYINGAKIIKEDQYFCGEKGNWNMYIEMK